MFNVVTSFLSWITLKLRLPLLLSSLQIESHFQSTFQFEMEIYFIKKFSTSHFIKQKLMQKFHLSRGAYSSFTAIKNYAKFVIMYKKSFRQRFTAIRSCFLLAFKEQMISKLFVILNLNENLCSENVRIIQKNPSKKKVTALQTWIQILRGWFFFCKTFERSATISIVKSSWALAFVYNCI